MSKKYKILSIIVSGIIVVSLIIGLIYYLAFYVPEKRNKEQQLEQIKQYYANKLDLYERENEQYADYEVDIAFLGDSLTDGYDLKNYYPDYLVSNRGIAGETTFGLEERLKVSIYDLKPKIAVMLIGGNNLYNMFDNYESILSGLKENLPNTKIVLLSLTAMGKEWGYKNEIACINNVKIKSLANKYGYTYIDLFTPLFDISTNEIYSEYTTDGAHLTKKGYEVVTASVKPVLDLLLNN